MIGAAGLFDIRLLGFLRSVPIRTAKRFIPWAKLGFLLNLTTGVVFLVSQPQQYATNLSFWFNALFPSSPAPTRWPRAEFARGSRGIQAAALA